MSPTLTPITVPDIGDFADVPVIEILVAEGDTVAAEDPLVTLESDKATMDVPSPVAGTVRALHVSLEDRVSQGALLLELEPADASEAGDAPPAEAGAVASAETAPGRAGGHAQAAAGANLQAELQDAAPEHSQHEDAPPERTGHETAAPASAAHGGGTNSVAGSQTSADAAPLYASPSARRLARELGVDIRALAGSGRLGRITAEDVRDAQHAPADAASAAATGSGAVGLPGLAPWPTVDFGKYGPVERVPRSRIQRISAPNMARNWVMIPHVTQHDEADITELEAWRQTLNAEQRDVKYTMLSFLVAAVVATLKAFPDFNASLDGDELVRKGYYNIGFAADTPNGLVVPVIRDADAKRLSEIATELSTLSGRAREGKLGPADITGSTFTISSLGGIGGGYFTPIINAPDVAILGVSRAVTKPVWDGAAFGPRLTVPLSLSYDHRVIDGAAAARFIVHLGTVLSDLRRVLL
ncbi:MAG TPA: 2-oxo acid dehydrogenase subunit E2 [Solirubrobacteraceae bacterium]|nr:2-oxo acid dehydrogenase subunit E2 [Solirubrobacteraceae bacterium]